MVPARRTRKGLALAVLGGGAGLFAVAVGLSAAPAARFEDICCAILSMDPARGLVTAFEYETSNIFTFTVTDRARRAEFKPCRAFAADLASVKPGQAFAADFGDEVNPSDPCCAMTAAPGTAGRVLGVKPHARHEGLSVILTDLKQEGDLVTASCLYCNGAATKYSLATDMRARARSAKLLDPVKRVQHEVVRVEGGGWLVSDHGPGLEIGPNQAVRTWVKFMAPAGSSVTLIWPGAAEPFENLTIAR